ncbi:MAG: hypothetical protein HQL73_02880 [Magnetococcales bacterium]|nr:hypothetical protein [Magnetococcales bacterium]
MSSHGYLALFTLLWIVYSCYLVLKNTRRAVQYPTVKTVPEAADFSGTR